MNNYLDLLIVPGIVFDIVGSRIGYGKGYYDRFIASISCNYLTIAGLGYNFQIYPGEFDHFKHDAKMDILVTEAGIKCFQS
jgi:5-formyltetrahydrofolate cyclo-ligase